MIVVWHVRGLYCMYFKFVGKSWSVSDILQVIVWRVFIVVGLTSLAEASDAAADDAAAEHDSDAYE